MTRSIVRPPIPVAPLRFPSPVFPPTATREDQRRHVQPSAAFDVPRAVEMAAEPASEPRAIACSDHALANSIPRDLPCRLSKRRSWKASPWLAGPAAAADTNGPVASRTPACDAGSEEVEPVGTSCEVPILVFPGCKRSLRICRTAAACPRFDADYYAEGLCAAVPGWTGGVGVAQPGRGAIGCGGVRGGVGRRRRASRRGVDGRTVSMFTSGPSAGWRANGRVSSWCVR